MIEIRILATQQDCSKEARQLTQHIQWGKNIILTTPERFQTTFSPERLKIILFLKENIPVNISGLAEKMGRSFEAVHRDVKILENHGIVKLRKVGRTVIPALAGRITVPIST